MKVEVTRRCRTSLIVASVLLMAMLSACQDDAGAPTGPADEAPGYETGVVEELPDGTRDTDGGGEPRSRPAWIMWSSCGEGSRAEEAAANGGAAAGWAIVDDLLEAPGVTLADYDVLDCPSAIAILGVDDTASPFDQLAAQLFAAELNLGTGSEQCPAAVQSVQAAHLALAALSYDGPGSVATDVGQATLQLVDLLLAYNNGSLCE